jgi:periplasmic protein TonB
MAFGGYGSQVMRRPFLAAVQRCCPPGRERLVYWSSLMVSVLVHSGAVVFALTHALLPLPEARIALAPPVKVELVQAPNGQIPGEYHAQPVPSAVIELAGGSAEDIITPALEALQVVPQASGGTNDRAATPLPLAEPLAEKAGQTGDPAASQNGETAARASAEPEEQPETANNNTLQSSTPPSMSSAVEAADTLAGQQNAAVDQPQTATDQPQPAGGEEATEPPPQEVKAKAAPREETARAEPREETATAEPQKDASSPRQDRGPETASVAPDSGHPKAKSTVDPAGKGEIQAYRRKVLTHLSANRPTGGIGKGIVRVAFQIARSGRVISARIQRSSGSQLLDRAALDSVRNASPYPPAPSAVKGASTQFNIPFYFQ